MSADDRDPRSNVLTERRQIAGLLGRVLRARPLLSIRFGDGEAHSSLLLEVAPLHGCLLLDAPFPTLLLHPGATVMVSGRLEGGHFAFSSVVESPTLSAEEGLLQLGFPERLQYRERRGSFRLAIPTQFALPLSDFSHARGRFRGSLADLSREGAGALLDSDPGTREGSLVSCLLRLSASNLPAVAQVRSRRDDGARLRLGLQLLKLTSAQEALLSAELAALQRRSLRARG